MFLGSRAWPVRRADNLTVLCEPIVWPVWHPQHLTTLKASRPVTEIALLYCQLMSSCSEYYGQANCG
jgi:hypothetical protein